MRIGTGRSIIFLSLLAIIFLGQSSIAAAQTRGGTLNVIINPEPAILVLGLSQQGPTQMIGGKIYEGLLTYDFSLKPIPSLAKSWTVSSDKKTYTFKLQENVRWHDGKPFTAQDVIFTTRDFLPKVHSRARQNFSHVAEWVAPDPYTVVFRLKTPFAPFLGAFQVASAPMMPKHIYEGTDFRNNPANAKPIGTGPFKFSEWRRGNYVHLLRNDDYWKPGKPYLDQIYYRVIPDPAARTLALETGQVHVASLNDIELFEVPRFSQHPMVELTFKGNEFFGQVGWMEINNRKPPLNDKRFRQALMYAIDREFVREKIWFGVGRVAHSPISSVTRFYDPNLPKYPYDPKKAEELLDNMGLKKGADGFRVTLRLLQSPYGGAWSRLAEYTKQALSRIGINIVIESTDAGAFTQKVSNWDFDLTFNMLLQFGDPALGVARSYISTNILKGVMFSNTMGYTNPKVDEVFDKAATTINDSERQKLYSEVQRILIDEVPVVWLLEMDFPTIVNRKVKNLVTTSIGVYDTWDSVYFAP